MTTIRRLALALCAFIALIFAPAAHAGTYTVYSCLDPVTGQSLGQTSPDGWTLQDSNPGENNYVEVSTCGTAGGSLTLTPFPGTGGETMPASGSSPRWANLAFHPPAHTTIRAYELWRQMSVTGHPLINVDRQHGGGTYAERCDAWTTTCSIGDPNSPLSVTNHVSETLADAGAPYIALQIYCSGTNCVKSMSTAQVRLFAAKIVLEDLDKPTFTSPPSGTLLQAGNVSGTRTLSFAASDVGSGVRKVLVSSSAAPGAPLAEKVVDSGNGHCDTDRFLFTVPCPQTIDDEMQVDTTRFPDGEQTITISVEDAAGNARSTTQAITVHNAPASTSAPEIGGFSGRIGAGDTLTCDPGTWSPSPDSVAYGWLVDGRAAGQPGPTYVVRSQDVGHAIVCRVSATHGGGTTKADSRPVGGSGQPGGPPAPGSCAGQPSGPKDPCGDYDGDGIRNAQDPDDDNDGIVDASDGAPFDHSVGAGAGGGNTVNVYVGPPTNGTHASNHAQFGITGHKQRTLGFGRATWVGMTLRDDSGRAIGGAVVTVLQRMNVPGAQWRTAHAPVRTDPNGRIRVRIKAGYSRVIRLAYKANLDNTAFQSVKDVVLVVKSRTTLKPNRHSFRNGQRIRFSGRLQSRPVPKGGVLLDLQARVGTHWQTFLTTRAARSGRWHASYRFRATSGTQHYRFRARLRKDTGFPYAPSASKPIEVTVRG